MENPVDHIVDLGLINYIKHPTNKDYIIFRFADINRANSFEEELKTLEIWFERSTKEGKQRDYYLFGIHKNDFKVASKINIKVEGKHKKPLIPFAFLRYFLLLFSAVVLTLAIMGYCEAQKKIQSVDETTVLINTPE